MPDGLNSAAIRKDIARIIISAKSVSDLNFCLSIRDINQTKDGINLTKIVFGISDKKEKISQGGLNFLTGY